MANTHSHIFRTATGQTGRDAYVNESAAIANELRELGARWARLQNAIMQEVPDGAVSMATVPDAPFLTCTPVKTYVAASCVFDAARVRDFLLKWNGLMADPEDPS